MLGYGVRPGSVPALDLAAITDLDGDHIALGLHFWIHMPAETEAAPVERDLQELAGRVSHRFGGTYCSTGVEHMDPDDPDSVIERPHLLVRLDVLHYDCIGQMPLPERVRRQQHDIMAFVMEHKPPRLGWLDLQHVHIDVLKGRGQWQAW
jgi:hypothetical protein